MIWRHDPHMGETGAHQTESHVLAIAAAVLLAAAILNGLDASARAPDLLSWRPDAPPGNGQTRDKILLGKALFWEEQLSSTRTIACGTCHRPEAGGADPRSVNGSAIATQLGPDGQPASMDDVVGSPGVPLQAVSGGPSPVFGMDAQVTRRRAPSVINAAFAHALPTDGRLPDCLVDPLSGDTVLFERAALERQVLEPVGSAIEMGGTRGGWESVVDRLEHAEPLALASRLPRDLVRFVEGRSYPELFRRAFGSRRITPSRIAMAIAAYERTLVSDQSSLDSVLAGLATLRADEEVGRRLFGSLGCTECHSGPLLSDQAFHYIGLNGGMRDSGRAAVTLRPEDFGAFRTPSLKNVSLRPAYMHGGQFHTLKDVVTFYYRGGCFRDADLKRPEALGDITIREVRSLVAFLDRPLVDPRVAGAKFPFDRPLLFTESRLAPDVLHEASSVAGTCLNPPMPLAIAPPLLGTPEFAVSVYEALAFAEATLLVTEDDPGLSLPPPSKGDLVRRGIRLSGDGATGGYGTVEFSLPTDSRLAGKVFHARWFVRDSGAPGGVAVSPPVRFQLLGPHWKGGRVEPAAAPRPPRLHPARYPRDPSTPVVRYEIFDADSLEILVEDARGQMIRRLQPLTFSRPGDYVIGWDARDSTLTIVGRGSYFLRVSGQKSSTRIAVEAGR